MSIDWDAVARVHWDAQRSPHDPHGRLTNGEYATAVKLATLTKFGGHASGSEASLFWQEFKQLGMSPKEYEEVLDRLAPVSFSLHGRAPSMSEIARLKGEHPKAVHDYYGALPDKHYPSVPAGEMARHLMAAEIPAQQALGRKPNKLEAAMLYHSRENPASFYSRMAPPKESLTTDANRDERGDDPRGRGLSPAGGSAVDQRDPGDR